MSKEHKHVVTHNFLNIQQIFNPQKSFRNLTLRAFKPYHQILSMLKHYVGGVEGYFDTSYMLPHT